MTNCITGHFSFYSVERVKPSNKGFNLDLFFLLPMLSIAKRSGMIAMLNKCVLKINNNV